MICYLAEYHSKTLKISSVGKDTQSAHIIRCCNYVLPNNLVEANKYSLGYVFILCVLKLVKLFLHLLWVFPWYHYFFHYWKYPLMKQNDSFIFRNNLLVLFQLYWKDLFLKDTASYFFSSWTKVLASAKIAPVGNVWFMLQHPFGTVSVKFQIQLNIRISLIDRKSVV